MRITTPPTRKLKATKKKKTTADEDSNKTSRLEVVSVPSVRVGVTLHRFWGLKNHKAVLIFLKWIPHVIRKYPILSRWDFALGHGKIRKPNSKKHSPISDPTKAEDDGTMRMRIRRSMQKGSTRRYTQFADGLWFGLWFPCGVTSMLQRKSRRK